LCCTELAGNAGPQNRQKIRHLGTIAQVCRAISSKLRHISTIGRNLLSSNISSRCSHNVMNFGPLAAEIGRVVWGTPANFSGFRVLAAFLHGAPVGVSQTLWRWTEGATSIRQGGHHIGHWPTFYFIIARIDVASIVFISTTGWILFKLSLSTSSLSSSQKQFKQCTGEYRCHSGAVRCRGPRTSKISRSFMYFSISVIAYDWLSLRCPEHVTPVLRDTLHCCLSLIALTTRLRWWPTAASMVYESSLLPRHLSSSCICRGPCDAEVSQLRRTRWAPNKMKALRSTQLPCWRSICLEQSTATPPKWWH